MQKQTIIMALCALLAGYAQHASAQGFVNLNFEAATSIPSSPSPPSYLNWNTAVPGWSHSSGGDTDGVYYGSEHLGHSQYYLLMDSMSPVYAPATHLSGAYSLAFSSGHLSGGNPESPWVQAYISQAGTIPVGTASLQMLASGPFQVTVGGSVIPMYSLGGNRYGGNVSSFAGSFAELRILNTAGTIHTPTIVDDIQFSIVPVPEPSTLALVSMGTLFLITCSRLSKSRTSESPASPPLR